MRLTILALATASGLALATAASASGGHGGGVAMGHVMGAAGGGAMGAAGLSGSLGPGMGGQGHIGGGAQGLGASGMGSGSLGPGMGNGGLGGNARMNSQGPFNASASGMAHANENSVLSGPISHPRADHDGDGEDHEHGAFTTVTSVTSGSLSGLADAQTVKTSSGATLGVVSKILVDKKGATEGVVVTQANGEKIFLPAKSLSFANNVVTTTSKRAAHEAGETAAQEAAERAHGHLTTVTSVASGSLSGLADAETVKTSSGATVGAVSKILVSASGQPVAVVVTQPNCEKVRLPASSLTLAGKVVTTSSKRAAHEASETAEANPHPSSITTGAFAGLAVGDTVKGSSGRTLGTVSRINVSDNGTVRAILVTTAGGKRFGLPANRLSVSGSTVTAAKASMTAHG